MVLKFTPLHFADRLTIINPYANTGVLTLWSTQASVIKLFEKASVDLSPASSEIAVFGNLYGSGLPHLLRNLLYNPQITRLVILGHDLSDSKKALVNFFKLGIEKFSFLGTDGYRVCETNHLIDGLVEPSSFAQQPEIVSLGLLSDPDTLEGIMKLSGIPHHPSYFEGVRMEMRLPGIPCIERFPSLPTSHSFSRESPLDAWRELIFRLERFGFRNEVQKRDSIQERIELLNTHVTIEFPYSNDTDELKAYNQDLVALKQYQASILNPMKSDDQTYTYGHRLRTHYGVDSIQAIGELLRDKPCTRKAYISVFDSSVDFNSGNPCPCLASLFFRQFSGLLTLTATFRTHNALDAWLPNVYGLRAILMEVSKISGLQTSCMTIISHSISIDPAELARARAIAADKKHDGYKCWITGKKRLRFDPNGYLRISTGVEDGRSIIKVEHSFLDQVIGVYKARSAAAICNKLARDCVISDPGHALYIGRKLSEAEAKLKAKHTPHKGE